MTWIFWISEKTMNPKKNHKTLHFRFSTFLLKNIKNYLYLWLNFSKAMTESKLFAPKTRLNSKWTLWFDDFNANLKSNPKEYEKNLYLISSFDCIEVQNFWKKERKRNKILLNFKNFWRTFNNIPGLKEIPISTSYHLMKFGVKPLW